jgi:hypothetical protein
MLLHLTNKTVRWLLSTPPPAFDAKLRRFAL